jgi:deazaflavin-dependent oxidoreductase (nitroreductase family)
MNTEHLIWRYVIRPVQWLHRRLYASGRTAVLGKIVLLLTTTGRKTGQPRVTPLQFSEIDGKFIVTSSRGQRADWFRNTQADPQVRVQVDQRQFSARAEPVTEAVAIADYLQGWLKRHPRLVGAMMHLHRLPSKPTRLQLEDLSRSLAMVILHPVLQNGSSRE